jgi:hypothetical protein
MKARSLVTVAAASSLAVTGCTPKHSMMAADVGVMAAGAAIRIASDPSHCDASDLSTDIRCAGRSIAGYYAGYALIAVGALLLLGTAALWPDEHGEPATPLGPAIAPATTTAMTPAAPSPAADSDLGRLARRAGIAARAGRCYEVHQLANAIDKLDPTHRERELEHDTAIAMCLD